MDWIRTLRCRYAVLVGLVVTLFGMPAWGQGTDTPASNEARIMLLQAKPRAYSVVEAGGRSDQPRVRLASIEAAEFATDAAEDLARNGLTDENPAVRFGALVIVGKLKLTNLAQAAMDLTQDENASVRAAAIFAAKRCGKQVDLTQLAQLMANGSVSVRANAAMLVGQLGDPGALPMLREMAAMPMPRALPAQRTWVRLQFAEAMVRLNPDDAEVLGTIRAGMYSTLDEVRVLAIQILGETGNKTTLGAMAHIVSQENPIHVRIAAAQALLQMGDDQGLPTLLKATRYDTEALQKDLRSFLRRADDKSNQALAIEELLDDPEQQVIVASEVRAQAARALGWSNSKASAERLAALMDDPQPIVRVAAAAAVLRAAR